LNALVKPEFSIRPVIDETTSHTAKQPKVGGKWLDIPRRRESSSSKNACEAGQLHGFVRFAGCFLLDSRLRGNDRFLV
jgi:hypothetical protein